MHDQNGVGPGVSQVATACHLLWPLNEELCKFLFTDSSSSLSLCTPGMLSGGHGGDTWPWGPYQILPVLGMFTLPQGYGVWFQEVCRGPCTNQDLLRQANLDKFTPRGQCPGGWVGGCL